MDGLPARTGVRLPSKRCQRWAPTQKCKSMYFSCWKCFLERLGEGPLSGIAPPAGHDEDDASTLATGRDEWCTHTPLHSITHTSVLSTLCPLAPQTNQSHSQQVSKNLLHADTAPDSPCLGCPQPSLPVFTLLWGPLALLQWPPPHRTGPQPLPSGHRPHRRRAWGPTSHPASAGFCTPPHTPQASAASSQALRAPHGN